MILTTLSGVALMLAAPVVSNPSLGKAEGQCRANESGPSFLVNVQGLKDRKGLLKLEVYPANDTDFLADDDKLINAGKTFRRVEVPVPAAKVPQLCVRVPGPGTYSIILLHDRDSNRKLGLSVDGAGFAGNPKIRLSQPKAAAASARAGNGPTTINIVMNYRKGLMSFGPLDK